MRNIDSDLPFELVKYKQPNCAYKNLNPKTDIKDVDFKNLSGFDCPVLIQTQGAFYIQNCSHITFSKIQSHGRLYIENCHHLTFDETFVDDDVEMINCHDINLGKKLECSAWMRLRGCQTIQLADHTRIEGVLGVIRYEEYFNENTQQDALMESNNISLPREHLYTGRDFSCDPKIIHGRCSAACFNEKDDFLTAFEADFFKQHFDLVTLPNGWDMGHVPEKPIDAAGITFGENAEILLQGTRYSSLAEVNEFIVNYQKHMNDTHSLPF